MAELDFMSVLHKSTKRITSHVSMTLNTQKQAAQLAKNFLKTIGMVIDVFAMEAIGILKGVGKSCSGKRALPTTIQPRSRYRMR